MNLNSWSSCLHLLPLEIIDFHHAHLSKCLILVCFETVYITWTLNLDFWFQKERNDDYTIKFIPTHWHVIFSTVSLIVLVYHLFWVWRHRPAVLALGGSSKPRSLWPCWVTPKPFKQSLYSIILCQFSFHCYLPSLTTILCHSSETHSQQQWLKELYSRTARNPSQFLVREALLAR